MADNFRSRHLELIQSDGNFFININSIVGRLSLFADHPKYKFKEAVNLNNKSHRTSGKLSLVKMKQKDLYILEDVDLHGNRIQNFIYVCEELSNSLEVRSFAKWLKEHIVDFLTRSISVSFFILYAIYFFTVLRYDNVSTILRMLRYITGVLTLIFAVLYYYLRSSKTKSSILKFCFKTELFIFIIIGTINNLEYLINLNNTTDTL